MDAKPPESANPSGSSPEKKKLPAWAILLAVVAFVIFNCFFALFAMQMGSGTQN